MRKGCLARPQDDIRSDGSRIEGSHKGWNSLQRSFACGLELFTALAHDFVLRRNCRVISDGRTQNPFIASTHGTHHVRLVNAIATAWNELVASDLRSKGKGHGSRTLGLLPVLVQIDSGEKFGVVVSEFTTSFMGLLEVKEEVKDETLSLLPEESEFDVETMMSNLNIDPALLGVPLLNPMLQITSSSENSGASTAGDATGTTGNIALQPIPFVKTTGALVISDTNATSMSLKRKAVDVVDELPSPTTQLAALAKKARVEDLDSIVMVSLQYPL